MASVPRLGVAFWSFPDQYEVEGELALEAGLRAPIAESLSLVEALGLKGVQLWCLEGPLAPHVLLGTERDAFRRSVLERGLTITGVETFAAPAKYWTEGFGHEATREEYIGRMERTLDLCKDLEAPSLSAHIGHVPEDPTARNWRVVEEAVREVAAYADKVGIDLALETGFESPAVLRRFIEAVGSGRVKVNYDPGNLEANGFDSVQGVTVLGELIVHTHVKDCIRDRGEVPLGTGQVRWREYFAALDKAGYSGWHCIEIEHGKSIRAGLKDAVRFLTSIPTFAADERRGNDG